MANLNFSSWVGNLSSSNPFSWVKEITRRSQLTQMENTVSSSLFSMANSKNLPLESLFQLSDIFLVDPFFAVATVTAYISVNQHGGEDRHSCHDVITRPICTSFSFYPKDIGASALGTYSSIFHSRSPFPFQEVYLEASLQNACCNCNHNHRDQ